LKSEADGQLPSSPGCNAGAATEPGRHTGEVAENCHCNINSFDWPEWAFEVPSYETLVRDWRNPDPQAIVEPIIAACNRHTNECRYDSTRGAWDFGDDAMMRSPIEILLLYRLRELIGLGML
jgi:hypothetical protein